MKKITVSTLILIFYHVSFSYALETDTHKIINEYNARQTVSGFSLNSYLMDDSLLIPGGVEQFFSGKQVWEWLSEGGLREDKPFWYIPYLRSVNHFHNPKTDKGFSGIWGTGFLSGRSTVQWSQLPIGTQSPGGHYSWHDVRDYFEKALTSTYKNDREKFFAETFRGLGQLMHLVQDMSVPEYVRDDGHYLRAYEGWVKGKDANNIDNVRIKNDIGEIEIKDIYDPLTERINTDYEPIQIASSDSFNQTELGEPSKFPETPVPIANLFDTNTYVGNNPVVTMQPNIGLAEYTTANFVSGGTIFSKDFEYPSRTSAPIIDVNIPDPLNVDSTVKRSYYFKSQDGDSGYLLAGVHYLYVYRETVMPDDPEDYDILRPMDMYVFAGYAKKLLPKAIGYSASLLQYFFRGEIDFVPDPDGDGYTIRNNSNEDIVDGTFTLYYDDNGGNRQQVPGALWQHVNISKNSPYYINYNLPSDLNAEQYILVFQGQLGNETRAVAGKVLPSPTRDILVYVKSISASNPVFVGTSFCDDNFTNYMNFDQCDRMEELQHNGADGRDKIQAYFSNITYELGLLGFDISEVNSVDFSGRAPIFQLGSSNCDILQEDVYQTITIKIGQHIWAVTSSETDALKLYGRHPDISITINLTNGERIHFGLDETNVHFNLDGTDTFYYYKTTKFPTNGCWNDFHYVIFKNYFGFASSPVVLYKKGVGFDPEYTFQISGYSENVNVGFDTTTYYCQPDTPDPPHESLQPTGESLSVNGPSIIKGISDTYHYWDNSCCVPGGRPPGCPDPLSRTPSIPLEGYIEKTTTAGDTIRTSVSVVSPY